MRTSTKSKKLRNLYGLSGVGEANMLTATGRSPTRTWFSSGVLDVSNSFAVPFDEDDKDSDVYFLDHDYLETMYGMFKKVLSDRSFAV